VTIDTGTNVLDAHVHLWNRARHPQPWIEPDTMAVIDRDFDAADLSTMLRATAADAAVVVQSTNSLAETTELLAIATEPDVCAVIGWVDLAGDVATQLACLRAGSGGDALRGIRHLAHLEQDPAWLLRADVGRGLAVLAEEGLSFDLVVRAHQLPVAVETARAHPTLRLVLDHLGNPPFAELDGWRHDLAALAAEPNVVAKLSGLVTAVASPWDGAALAPAVDGAVEVFGPGRLMYGSDWPLAELAEGGAVAWAGAVRALAAGLSDAERASLLGGTCAGTYGIAA
jgi:L-fuconolactonase